MTTLNELWMKHMGRPRPTKNIRKARRRLAKIEKRGPSPCCGAHILKPKHSKPFCSGCFNNV